MLYQGGSLAIPNMAYATQIKNFYKSFFVRMNRNLYFECVFQFIGLSYTI